MKLWIPGPTEVRPALLEAIAAPMIGHRSGAMTAAIERLDPGLKLAFGLAEGSSAQVAVHSVSATAMMESSLLGAGRRKVLSLVNGAFSERFAEVAELIGLEVRRLSVPMGEVVPPAAVAQVLAEEGPFDAVTVVSSETSTGTATPLAPLAKVLQPYPETWLLVDLVSWIAGAPVDFDACGIDFAFAGVQKAFALPPGISVGCASARYLERAATVPQRGFALDPVLIFEGHAKRKTPATPCIPLYFGLGQQLEDIGPTAADWRARFDRHRRMQRTTIDWAAGHGLSLLPEEQFGSPTVSCIRAGDLDVAALVAGLAERGLQISNGYGDLKGKTFRIGHMGDHTEAGLADLLAAADEVLAG
ncbi:MAG: aminotransferase class V-fold PLP-dependent enzyme [Planctomycetota bacterium]|nr:aminotransferase class V-fold PLP-dependent enzyme [Planctomycetota bacterium]